MQHHVFISHSAKEADLARRIAAALRSAGVRTWMAPDDIVPGTDWGAAITTAINECRLMILMLTADSNGSRQVVREVQLADAGNHPIIPLRMEALELSPSLKYFLSASQWLDATTLGEEEMLRELVEAVVARMPGEAGPAPDATGTEAAPASISPRSEPALPPVSAHADPTPHAPVGGGFSRPVLWIAAAGAVASIYYTVSLFDRMEPASKAGEDSTVVAPRDSAPVNPIPAEYAPGAKSPPWLLFAWNERSVSDDPADSLRLRFNQYLATVGEDPANPPSDWSAAFVNWAITGARYEGITINENLAWLQWGKPLDELREGCVIVLRPSPRSRATHSGFFLYRRDDVVAVLGGNTQNRVKVTFYPVERVLGCRFPRNY
jgi:hypothetical protein